MKAWIAALSLAAAVPAVLPEQAAAWNDRRAARINTVSQDVFEVVPGIASGRIFWCVAADHAQRTLKAPWNADLYITRGLGPSETTGRVSAVQFTLNPDLAPAASRGNINSLEAGQRLSVQRAYDYCYRLPGRR
ncbi:hypothetical protein [Leisingera sp. ANG-Vp]|uniref:hypothetical protein n=1 Tax=Leisingera sp. ANG-Vp TaxID=1577896 RepID=UPI00057CD25E|nr:hypothetical protein [Leisingera sp. ANG-Vp]KIC13804.1 hypothetical protein RA20_22265 [Leisingera sp. ANG-Vp]